MKSGFLRFNISQGSMVHLVVGLIGDGCNSSRSSSVRRTNMAWNAAAFRGLLLLWFDIFNAHDFSCSPSLVNTMTHSTKTTTNVSLTLNDALITRTLTGFCLDNVIVTQPQAGKHLIWASLQGLYCDQGTQSSTPKNQQESLWKVGRLNQGKQDCSP